MNKGESSTASFIIRARHSNLLLWGTYQIVEAEQTRWSHDYGKCLHSEGFTHMIKIIISIEWKAWYHRRWVNDIDKTV